MYIKYSLQDIILISEKQYSSCLTSGKRKSLTKYLLLKHGTEIKVLLLNNLILNILPIKEKAIFNLLFYKPNECIGICVLKINMLLR